MYRHIKADKILVPQNPRWLVQEPLRMDGHCLYARVPHPFTISWVQWHDYREENIRLKIVADKHKVTAAILKELYPELSINIGAYEKLAETIGADSTLVVFCKQVERVKKKTQPSSPD